MVFGGLYGMELQEGSFRLFIARLPKYKINESKKEASRLFFY
jgi:hypothetical protein